MMRGPGDACRWVLVGAASLVALASLTLALLWSDLFDALIASQLELAPDSRAYQEWVTPSVPIYFDVYMFNWTNADKFPEEMPKLQEIGPYRFREHRRHVNISWHAHNASVGYRTHRRWHFEPATSGGRLDDTLSMPNVVAASAAYRSRQWGFMRQSTVNMGLNLYKQKLFITKTAGELLFEGYPDEMLDMARTLPSSMTGGAPPVDKFGWFYGRNNSVLTEGYMEVTTGKKSGTLPGQLLKWNYESNLHYYQGSCSKLDGSAGEFMPRNLTTESILSMFVPDLCRPLHLRYTGSGETHGLPYHTYAVDERSFDNSSSYHENTCFCQGACSYSGLMNVSACRYGAPAFVSLPHFLYGDPVLRQNISGLRPDPEKHAFYFSVEPNLGIPLDVAARFQLNVLLQPNRNIEISIGLRFETPVCCEHRCPCGKEIDQFGTHGLSCIKSAGRLSHHSSLNDTIKRALASIEVPALLEPKGIIREDGKRPDGMTLIPWERGRALVWDATCVDTLAPSHLRETVIKAGAAAEIVESNKRRNLFEDIPELYFPILWVEQHVKASESILEELRVVRNVLDWGGMVCAGVALFLGATIALVIFGHVCSKRIQGYSAASKTPDLVIKDEAEMKLNPM